MLVVLTPIAAISHGFSQMGKAHEDTRSPSDDVTFSFCHRDPTTGTPMAPVRAEKRSAGPVGYKVYAVSPSTVISTIVLRGTGRCASFSTHGATAGGPR